MLMRSLLLRSAFFCIFPALGWTFSPAAAQQGAGSAAADPKITSLKITKLASQAQAPLATFRLAILGENLPTLKSANDVVLDTQDPGKPIEHQESIFVSPEEIDVSGEAPVGTVITAVKIRSGDKAFASPDGMNVAFKPTNKPTTPSNALKEFMVKLDPQTPQTSKDFPNLHTVILTKVSGEGEFDNNPNRMRVELEPPVATDLSIVMVNPEQLELHFVAAADYTPKNVLVTVFDSSDLDRRKAKAVAKLAPATPPEDPNAPSITKVETIFIDRRSGNGRIRIYGKNFGIQARPRFSVDDYLCNCHERSTFSGGRTCGKFATEDNSTTEACTNMEIRNQKDAAEEKRKCLCGFLQARWNDYQRDVHKVLAVGITSRNIDIRIEKTEVIDGSDGMVDVYFEFTRHKGYAWPFQLAGVDLTLNKTTTHSEQTVMGDGVSAEVDMKTSSIVTLSKTIGPDPDPNLTYQYTVLDQSSAQGSLGEGVAKNFYVVELSVVNHGTSTVAVPLASIQAEVEWLYGYGEKHSQQGGDAIENEGYGGKQTEDFYIEGPATIAPSALSAVSAFFGTYQKSKSGRAWTFNILDGITTLATALIPYAGPAFKDAEIVLSSGLAPGLRQAWPDLLAQQLQNLTSLSWGATEMVPASGGSVSKYVYIQRQSQTPDLTEPTAPTPRRTKRQISSIMGMEVSGFVVPDSIAKQATPAATNSAPPAATSSQANQK